MSKKLTLKDLNRKIHVIYDLQKENEKLREFTKNISNKSCFKAGSIQYAIGCDCDSCEARNILKELGCRKDIQYGDIDLSSDEEFEEIEL